MPIINPAGGGGTTSADTLLGSGLGIVAQPFNVVAASSQVALTSGTIFCVAVGIRQGVVVTNMLTNVTTAGSGTAPTLIRQGISDSTGKMLAVTATSQANATWTALGMSSVALTAPLTIPVDGLYYLCIIEVGAFGTTPLQLRRSAAVAGTGSVSGFPRPLAAQTAQADLPAVNSSITLGGGGVEGFWQGAS